MGYWQHICHNAATVCGGYNRSVILSRLSLTGSSFRGPHCSSQSSQPSLISLRISDSWDSSRTKFDYRMLIRKFLLFQLSSRDFDTPANYCGSSNQSKEKKQMLRALILYSLARCFCHKVQGSAVLHHKLASVLQLSWVNPRLLAPH